ncbi:MAG: GlsB/YeaQ/YmgE family stress response membrane protein [bacterium]
MNILIWLVVGLIAGWLAGKVMRGKGFGVVGDIIVGLVGAVIGGWIFRQVGLIATGILGNVIVAFIGAVVLVWVIHTLKKV